MKHLPKTLIALAIAAFPVPSMAVYLSADGSGQALIFPYYSVQSSAGNAFNTYVTIVNTKNETKVIKVRFREGRNARPVAEFNVYLDRFDAWTAAIGPDGDGARLVTHDRSCTNPAISSQGLRFSSVTGDDGAGGGSSRGREGYVEVFEMGTLSGEGEANVRHRADGSIVNCAIAQGSSPPLGTIGAPSGGLTGTGTLINVNSGLDITYNADALAELSSQPMYSDPGQSGTDFDAPQIDPVSHIIADNKSYRLVWTRPVDAVTSVYMGSPIENEFVVETATRSRTDWVVTFPTRRFYVGVGTAQPPFSTAFGTNSANCEGLVRLASNREAETPDLAFGFPIPPAQIPSKYRACWSANAFSIRREGGDTATNASSDVFGSANTLWRSLPDASGAIMVPSSFEGGHLALSFQANGSLVSLPSSASTDLRTGLVSPGAYRVVGMPFTGFMARTFENGTLTCNAGLCQGNYSGAFAHKKSRTVVAP